MPTEVEALQTAIGLHQAGQWSQVAEICRQLLAANPAQPEALYLLGVAQHKTGHHEQAARYIGQAIAAGPPQPAYHNSLGEVYLALGNAPEARACFERALELDASFAAAHYNLGLLCQQEQPARARRHFERTIATVPDHALAHQRLGQVLLAEGKADEGVAAFRRALAHEPNSPAALSNFAPLTQHLENAARLHPDRAEAHLNLGLAHAASAAWDRATECFERAARLDTGCFEARRRLAGALEAQGHLDAALAVLAESAGRRPDDVEALVEYGRLLQRAGRAYESLEAFQQALCVKPEAAALHYHRAGALQDLNRFEEAKQALRDAIRRQPHFPEAYSNLAILCLKNVLYAHKCLFIHIPKNGGTSIKNVLDLPGGGHRSWHYYATHYPQVWQQYSSFAVVRNPWDRAVSAYHHARMKESMWHNEQTGLHPDYEFLLDKSFAECVSILYHERPRLKHDSWLEQSHYIVDSSSHRRPIVVDTVLRFETLADDFAAFCRERGIHCGTLPTVNRSQRSRDYRSYYDERTQKMIGEVYRADIEKFGYSF